MRIWNFLDRFHEMPGPNNYTGLASRGTRGGKIAVAPTNTTYRRPRDAPATALSRISLFFKFRFNFGPILVIASNNVNSTANSEARGRNAFVAFVKISSPPGNPQTDFEAQLLKILKPSLISSGNVPMYRVTYLVEESNQASVYHRIGHFSQRIGR